MPPVPRDASIPGTAGSTNNAVGCRMSNMSDIIRRSFRTAMVVNALFGSSKKQMCLS